jgi:amidase
VVTFITRFEPGGGGVRLAVKDVIDMAGIPTTAGCRALAEIAQPAPADALCLAGARAARARIVGRANLHELALGVTGINPWFGTPVNPLDPRCVPGGSSSGSAVAVATGEADVAYGTDTGGSVRIPSACCGTTGLKTTWGRVPLVGVWPLSPSLDTVGPMARDVQGVITGMRLLEPGFSPDAAGPERIGRLRVDADPLIDVAIDRALMATGCDVVDVHLPGWDEATRSTRDLLVAEAWASDGELAELHPGKIGDDVVARLYLGRMVDRAALASVRAVHARWVAELEATFEQVDLIATPTLTIFPPTLERGEELLTSRCTLPVNLAGVPALAIPVATAGPFPASLQLIAPLHGEERLLAAGLVVEAAAATL